MFSFAHPEALLLLPAWAAAAWLLPRAGLRRPLRLLCALLLIAAAADPRFRQPAKGLDLWVLVDRSLSAQDAIAPRLPEIQSLLEQSRGRHDRLHFVDFAHEAILRDPLSAAVLTGRLDATRIGNAIRHALLHADGTRGNRLLLLSDGYSTEPLDEVGELLRRQGVPLDLRLFAPPTPVDAAVESLQAPLRVRSGEPFVVEARLRGPPGAVVSHRLLRDGVLQQEGRTVLEDGTVRLRWADLLPVAGAATYEVSIEMPGDAWSGNNRQSHIVEAGGARRVLLVSAYADDPLPAILRASGFDVDLITDPSRLREGSLSGAAAVLLNNVPANALPAAFLRALPFFVTEQGGGLILFGGASSFGAGGYFESPIDELLPVSMELRQEHRKLAVAMAIVMDRSGSMTATVGGVTKMDLANAGAARAIELLGDLDALTVFAVDTEAHLIAPLTTLGGNRAKLLNVVRSIRSSGGGIYVRTGLEAAWKQLEKARQGQRHVILFSDAADSEQPDGVPELVARMVAEGATLSVIALGTEQDADAAFLIDTAARGQGRIFFCDDAATLPSVFAQETVSVSRSAFIKDPVATREEAGWREVAATTPAWPTAVDGFNLSYLREGATVSLSSGDEYAAPLVAHWQRGAGRSAAVSFPIAGDYSDRIRAWAEYGDFVRTLVGWVARPEWPPGLALRLNRVGETLRVELHADAEWQERFAVTPPQLTSAGSGSESVRRHAWRRLGPGLLEASIELAADESLRGALRIGSQTLPFGPVVGRAGAEWRFDPAMPRMLRQTALASGGIERVDLSGVWTAPVRMETRGIRAYLLVLLLLAFLAEALVSRLEGRLPEWGIVAQRPTERAPAPSRGNSPDRHRKPPPSSDEAASANRRLDTFRRARLNRR